MRIYDLLRKSVRPKVSGRRALMFLGKPRNERQGTAPAPRRSAPWFLGFGILVELGGEGFARLSLFIDPGDLQPFWSVGDGGHGNGFPGVVIPDPEPGAWFRAMAPGLVRHGVLSGE
jgi:hypothetical protein